MMYDVVPCRDCQRQLSIQLTWCDYWLGTKCRSARRDAAGNGVGATAAVDVVVGAARLLRRTVIALVRAVRSLR